MRRTLVLAALVAAAVFATMGGTAQAAAGCGTHQVAITDWSEPHTVDVAFDFQCGGTTSNYRLVFHLQASVAGGWVFDACGGGGEECTTYRPGASSYYGMGVEHGCLNRGCGPDWTWQDSAGIGNTYMRVQAVVHFANGDPNIVYYSAERKL